MLTAQLSSAQHNSLVVHACFFCLLQTRWPPPSPAVPCLQLKAFIATNTIKPSKEGA